MIHRTSMRMLNADDAPEANVRAVLESPYTRMPIWRGTTDNIIGIIHAKDVLRVLADASNDTYRMDVVKIAQKPWFVPDTTSVPDQLNAFLRRKAHIAIVVDEYRILNEDGLPKLRISPYYAKVLRGHGTKEDRAYVKNKLDSADFLIKSIYKRQGTIYKVVKSILERQMDFFERGIDHLRPMVLRDVADEIGVHESTVSRVTSNKYIQCPQGIFELKYFFNAGIQQIHGSEVAAESVKNRIKLLIQAEDQKRPLSDAQLVKELRRYNIQCARRTVAKYREGLGILSSSKRKQLF